MCNTDRTGSDCWKPITRCTSISHRLLNRVMIALMWSCCRLMSAVARLLQAIYTKNRRGLRLPSCKVRWALICIPGILSSLLFLSKLDCSNDIEDISG